MNLTATANDNTLLVKWDPVPRSCAQLIEYKVEYKLINEDQCLENINGALQLESVTNATQVTLEDLYQYSTYAIYVTTRFNNVNESKKASVNVTTGEIGELELNLNH